MLYFITGMRIGVLSDTHGYADPQLSDVFSGVDRILHAGDVGSLAVLDALARIAPVTAVWGNVDGAPIRRRTEEAAWLEFDGVSIWMTHIAGRPGRWQRGMGRRLRDKRPDLFICGHSHILRIERVKTLDNMLFLNPGAAGRQGLHTRRTCVRLDIARGAVTSADVIHLDEQ